MNRFLFLIILSLATSCQFFETEKLSTETIYQEELKSINWKDVDQYPAFPECTSIIDKQEQKTCFVASLSKQIYKSINQQDYLVHQQFEDTIMLTIVIDKTGKMKLEKVLMDSLVQNYFPYLEVLLAKSLDSLQPVNPAQKRAIPVKTQFTLPIILATSDL